MKRWGVIDQNTHTVINVIIWDGITEWKPPANTYLVQHDAAEINCTYDPQSGILTNHNQPVPD
jgi:hypothetical protein